MMKKYLLLLLVLFSIGLSAQKAPKNSRAFRPGANGTVKGTDASGEVDDIMPEVLMAGLSSYPNGAIVNISGVLYKNISGGALSTQPPANGWAIANDPKALYVLASGQSNMDGNGTGGDVTTNPNVFAWDYVGAQWVVATIGSEPFETVNGYNNLAFHFCKKLQEETGKTVYLVISAQGSQSIDEWVPNTGTQWTNLTSRVSASGVTEFDYFLWHQGEQDNASTNADYETKYDLLKDQLRAESWFDETTPIVIGELLQGGSVSGQNGFITTVNSDNDPWDAYASASGLTDVDGVHFDGPSLVTFGRERYWEASQALPQYSSSDGSISTTEQIITEERSLDFNNLDLYYKGSGRFIIGNIQGQSINPAKLTIESDAGQRGIHSEASSTSQAHYFINSSTGTAVQAFNTAGGQALTLIGAGSSSSASSGRVLNATRQAGVANEANLMAQYTQTTSGTAAAGFGSYYNYLLEHDAGATSNAFRWGFDFTNSTLATIATRYFVNTRGVTNELTPQMELYGNYLDAGVERAVFTGDIQVTGGFRDSDGDIGASGEILSSTLSGTDWVSSSSIGDDLGNGDSKGNQITNLADGTLANDAAILGQVDVAYVADYTELAAYSGIQETVIVGDALTGGTFIVDATATTVDGGIVPVSGYRRLVEDAVLPEWWGAIPDDAFNDGPAIQSAVQYAYDNGLYVFLSGNSYNVGAGIVYPNNSDGNKNVNIKGAGRNTTTITSTSAITALFDFSGTTSQSGGTPARTFINVSDLKFDCANITDYAILAYTTTYSNFERIRILGADVAGIGIGYGWVNTFKDILIQNATGGGIEFVQGQVNSALIEHCTFLDLEGNAIWGTNDHYQIQILSCVFEKTDKAAVNLSAVRNLSMHNNYFEEVGLVGDTYTSPAITIKSQILLNGSATPSTSLTDASPCRSISITNNFISALGGGGTTSDYFIFANAVEGLTVADNTLHSGSIPIVCYNADSSEGRAVDVDLRNNTDFLPPVMIQEVSGRFLQGANTHNYDFVPKVNYAAGDRANPNTYSDQLAVTFSPTYTKQGVVDETQEYLVSTGGMSGNSSVRGFNFNIADYPELQGKVVVFRLEAKTLNNPDFSSVQMYTNNGTGGFKSHNASGTTMGADWGAVVTSATMPTSGTVFFGYRFISLDAAETPSIRNIALYELGTNDYMGVVKSFPYEDYPITNPTGGTNTLQDALNDLNPTTGTTTGTTDANGDIVIAHGLGSTPTYVQVSVGEGTPLLAQPMVSLSNGTNMFIRIFSPNTGGASVGAGTTATLHWNAK